MVRQLLLTEEPTAQLAEGASARVTTALERWAIDDELLRGLLEDGGFLPAEGAGDLVGPDRARSRTLRQAVERRQRARQQRAAEVERRREEVHREVEAAREEEARQRRERTRHVAEKTLSLARALFPKSIQRMPEGGRQAPFPGSLPGRDMVDLMLVAPAVEVVREEASPLMKEIEPSAQVRSGASQSPTKQRGDDPARLEKFLSPEKIDEFANRVLGLLIEEIALDNERHGVDSYGYDKPV